MKRLMVVVCCLVPLALALAAQSASAAGGCHTVYGANAGVGVGYPPLGAWAGAEQSYCQFYAGGGGVGGIGLRYNCSSLCSSNTGFQCLNPLGCVAAPWPPVARCTWVTLSMDAPGHGNVHETSSNICSLTLVGELKL